MWLGGAPPLTSWLARSRRSCPWCPEQRRAAGAMRGSGRSSTSSRSSRAGTRGCSAASGRGRQSSQGVCSPASVRGRGFIQSSARCAESFRHDRARGGCGSYHLARGAERPVSVWVTTATWLRCLGIRPSVQRLPGSRACISREAARMFHDELAFSRDAFTAKTHSARRRARHAARAAHRPLARGEGGHPSPPPFRVSTICLMARLLSMLRRGMSASNTAQSRLISAPPFCQSPDTPPADHSPPLLTAGARR